MAQFPKPDEGSCTEHYPSLGTGVMSYEDCISPAFYELDRRAGPPDVTAERRLPGRRRRARHG